MMKRLFIAINLPDDFLDILCEFQRQYEDSNRIRWTPRENLHITVCFIGDVGGNEIPEISARLEKIAEDASPFEIEFKEIVFAPPFREPRMIWAVFDSSPEFRKLMADMQNSLREFLQKENTNKEAIAHVTLARFQNGMEAACRLMLEQPQELIGKKFLVSAASLMESELSKEGAKYKTISEFRIPNFE